MTAASFHPGTFGHIRGEKKGAGSIDVNYADVTREGAQWSVSPPKESIKVKQFVSPSFFSPLQRFNSVTTAAMCRITAHVNAHKTKLNPTAETHKHQTSNEKRAEWENTNRFPHPQKLPPAQSHRWSMSLTCKLGDGCGIIMKCMSSQRRLQKVLFWFPSWLGLCLDY